MEEAELAVIATEISLLLSEKHTVSRQSSIYKLDPILENGLLRVGGRLSKGVMPSEEKKGAAYLQASSQEHASTAGTQWAKSYTIYTQEEILDNKCQCGCEEDHIPVQLLQTPEWQGHGTEDGGSS